MVTRPPTEEDWKQPETEADWKRHHERSAKRMGAHDKLPRDVRLALHDLGELPEWQMNSILSALKRGQVALIVHYGKKYVMRPDRRDASRGA